MIWDSRPWRAELGRLAARLERRTKQSRWSEASSARLEQDVFIAAYAVRKLLEANKLSTSLADKLVDVKTYPRMSRQMDHLNWHRLDYHFDLERGEQGTLRLRELCNQIIHSYVFMAKFEGAPAKLTGLFLSSDVQRRHVLYEIDVAALIVLLRRIADDNPNHALSARNPRTWEWTVYQWDSNHETPDESKLDAIRHQQTAALDAFHVWNEQE